MKLKFYFFSVIISFIGIISPNVLFAQGVPPSDAKVVTLTTEENATVNLDLKSKNANTPVWIETSEGNFISISVGNDWTGFSDYSIIGNTLKIYGDITEFQCSGIADNKDVKAIDATNHSLLEIILCYDNKISDIKIEGCTNLHSIYCDTNLLDACALNEIYANLPIRDSANKGKLYVKDDQGTNPGIATSNTSVAVAKNWMVADLNNSEGDIELTGDGTGCPQNTPPVDAKVITLNTAENSTIKLKIMADADNTPIWIKSSPDSYEKVIVGKSYQNYEVTVIGAEISVYGDVSGFGSSINNDKLKSLDITQNSTLKELHCFSNDLSELDLTQNKDLVFLSCGGNKIKSLDLSQNIKLQQLYCGSNLMTSLDVSENKELTVLYFYNNHIANVDLSQNVKLYALYGYNNSLVNLNVANGNNNGLYYFDVRNNPNLKCIQIDEGFTPPTTGNYKWEKDSTAEWSTTPCSVSTSEIGSVENSLKVFPNPAKDYFILSGLKEGEFNNIKVFNTLGKEIMSLYSKEAEIKINLNSIPAGLYILSVQSKGLNNSLKLIKK